VNTTGAVFGCLLAGFYLLRIYDVAIATYVAAGINMVVAIVSFGLVARTAPATTGISEQSLQKPSSHTTDWPVYLIIASSGACALGAEVIWTRLMAMMLGSTVYVFSIILAVFLVGLAIGSAVASWLLRVVRPRLALGWSQLLVCAAIAFTAYMIADSLPYWPANALLENNPWHNFEAGLLRCLAALLPPTLLWGASFPFACVAVAASSGKEPGKVVGNVYAANTLGSIVGALGISLILIPAIGTHQSQRVLLVLAAASGLALVIPHVWMRRSRVLAAGLVAAIVFIVALLTSRVHAIPGALIAYGRRMTLNAPSSRVLYTAEGINSSLAITRWDDGSIEIDVNGHVEATTEPFDMKLQRMVGHLPALLHPNPKSVLGIGFGAGVSAGTFTRYPGIQKITVCEIEPIIPPVSTRFFAREDYDVLHNPRTRIIYDDARHYVLTASERFDIIASDPLDVFVKGTAAIYSNEYFEAVKRHLNPGGMFTLYVPLYESDARTVQSELATFFAVFPYGTIWANTRDGQGYDMVFMGQADPLRVDLDELERRFERPDYAPVAESLREIGIGSPIELLSAYAGQFSDLESWLKDAPINRDRNLRLQYLAGWGINSQFADELYRQILSYRHPPSKLFEGSREKLQSLQRALSLTASGTF
jgi:spermidine synthase